QPELLLYHGGCYLGWKSRCKRLNQISGLALTPRPARPLRFACLPPPQERGSSRPSCAPLSRRNGRGAGGEGHHVTPRTDGTSAVPRCDHSQPYFIFFLFFVFSLCERKNENR